MKKVITALFLIIMAGGMALSQGTEKLTNNSVVKMVKAKLSDEVIIDMIQNSEVSFDLSKTSLEYLKSQNVSQKVIDAMSAATSFQNASVTPVKQTSMAKETEKPADKNQTVEEGRPTAPGDRNEKLTGTIDKSSTESAMGYTIPLKDLVSFYEREFENITIAIETWNKEIRVLQFEAESLNAKIAATENKLREKKNSDSKSFNQDIVILKKELSGYRAEYKNLKNKMIQYGLTITKKIADISKEETASLSKEYNTVGQKIRNTNSDLSKEIESYDIIFSSRIVTDNTARYISPATEILFWHQNQIDDLHLLFSEWIVKVENISRKDDVLKGKLEPLEKKMSEYRENSKKYKSEISELKKQISAIEKQRKLLGEEMAKDSRELAEEIKKKSMAAQASLKERYSDIIENINYTYQEKLNL